MEKFVPFLNMISLVALLLALICMLPKLVKLKSKPYRLVFLALIFLLVTTITNLLEHLNLSSNVDKYEDFIEILFLPLLIFSIHAAIIEEELKKSVLSEAKFKAIFNHAFSFVGLLDKEGNIIEANDTSLQFVQVENSHVKNRYFANTAWWAHDEQEQIKIKQAIDSARNGEFVRLETTHLDKNGKLHFIDFTLKPLYDGKGNLVFLIAEGRDITEIKEAKLEIEKHRNHLEELVKYRTEELVTINNELYDKNIILEDFNIQLSKNKLTLEQALKELQETQDHLIESEKMASIGVLTSGIAHEINNPINFISQSVFLLKQSIGQIQELMESQKELIKKIKDDEILIELETIESQFAKDKNLETIQMLLGYMQEGVDRTTDIIKSLRYFVHSSKEVMYQVNIHELIESVLTILYNQYKDRIAIKKEFELNEPLNCIPGKISQVIMNLMVNAISAIEGEGTITIRTFKKPNSKYISITDTGTGIPKEIRGKIFDPFFTTKPVGRGTGLGLSISYKIIEEHNGTITVSSTEGKGSEFLIGFPDV